MDEDPWRSSLLKVDALPAAMQVKRSAAHEPHHCMPPVDGHPSPAFRPVAACAQVTTSVWLLVISAASEVLVNLRWGSNCTSSE